MCSSTTTPPSNVYSLVLKYGVKFTFNFQVHYLLTFTQHSNCGALPFLIRPSQFFAPRSSLVTCCRRTAIDTATRTEIEGHLARLSLLHAIYASQLIQGCEACPRIQPQQEVANKVRAYVN
jgi:hypothetical protein